MYTSLPYPKIDPDECKSCERCIHACPKKVLKLSPHFNKKGVHPVEYSGKGCIGCGICFYTCPEPYAIEVHKK